MSSNNENIDRYDEQLEPIDISGVVDDMWKGFKRFLIPLIIVVVICGGLFYAKTRFSYSPYYTASATYTVSSSSGSDSYTNQATAAQLGTSLGYILPSTVMQTMVAEDMEVDEIPGTIRVSVMEDTNLFTISVDSENPQDAYDVLQTVIQDYPKVAAPVIGNTELSMMDESGVPTSPANRPDYRTQVEIGVGIGIVIDIIFLLIYALTRQTIKKEEDFKKYLSVECFGVIPRARFKRRGKKGDAGRQLVLLDNPRIPPGYKESIRSVRNRLERKVREKEHKVIIVTSAIPGEGKSTVAANIAVSLAMKGKKVILADLDLRNPSLADVMNLDVPNGTIDVLRGKVNLDEALANYQETSLQVLIGGKPTGNTTRTLSGSSADEFFEQLRQKADYVILDTPPCAILSDATIVARHADAAVFVVRQDFARTDRILEGIRNLAETGVEICGCVLNYAQVGVTGYGYSHSYGYGRYGYGYGSKKYGYGYGGYGYGYGDKKEKKKSE